MNHVSNLENGNHKQTQLSKSETKNKKKIYFSCIQFKKEGNLLDEIKKNKQTCPAVSSLFECCGFGVDIYTLK